MRSVAYAFLVGVVGAVVMHLLVVFLIPLLGGGRVYAALQDAASAEGPLVLTDAQARKAGIVGGDPGFMTRVCFFDLDRGLLRVRSSGAVPFWSVAVLNTRDEVAFSLADRLAVRDRLDMIVVKANGSATNVSSTIDGAAEAVQVTVPQSIGYVLIRAFVPDPSQAEAVREFLQAVSCSSVEPAPSGG